MPNDSVVIVGAGVIGAWSAYFLNEAGFNVTLVDKGRFAGECSHANCGLICPSHALPLCVPQALLKPLKSMFNSYAPFYVNPLVGPSLWKWLWKFAKSCHASQTLEAARARHALLESSMYLYQDLIEKENLDCEFQQKGLLFVHVDQKSMDHFEETNNFLSENFGLNAVRYDCRELINLEPALKDSVIGGWHYEGDAHLRPDSLMSELKRVLLKRGVEIKEQCYIEDFIFESNNVVGVKSSDGELTCSKVLLATGALAPRLAQRLGVKLYMQPGKGYSITTNRPPICPDIPMILEDHSVAVTPFQNGFRLGSTMEFGGYDATINRKRMGLLESGAKHYLRDVRGEEIQEEWFGWRPMSYNDIPIISQTNIENAYIATGHSMLGLSMGTGTGKLISEMMSGDKPHLPTNDFHL